MKFSANLGFLWADRPLPDAIRAAKAAGFRRGRMPLALRCARGRGDSCAGRDGSADAGPQHSSRRCRLRATTACPPCPGARPRPAPPSTRRLAYARATGTRAVHVMAGFSGGPRAHAAFCENLRYACDQAAPDGIDILIEPLNHYDAPGYFLGTSAQAAAIIRELGLPNLKLMFDCYHLQIMEGDLTRRLSRSAAADRSYPDRLGPRPGRAGSWRAGLRPCAGPYRQPWLARARRGGIQARPGHRQHPGMDGPIPARLAPETPRPAPSPIFERL